VKRVLFLAYYFPPAGGAGVQRSVKFARYLPELGYEPVVVTGSGETGGRWTPRDESLADELPGEVEVRRVPGPEPAGSGGWRGRGERWLWLTPPFTRWWTPGAVRSSLAPRPAVELVYASMSPFQTAEAAERVARALGVPWVADLRDPWALDEMWVYPTRLHRHRDLARMERGLSSAAAIVMNTPEAARRILDRFPGLERTPVTVIPNGFDAADFEGDVPARADGAFRIVHTGYLHTELGATHRRANALRRLLGGTQLEVDILTRSHVYLLGGLEQLARDDAALASSVELHLAGVLSAGDIASTASSAVHLHGYLSHADTIALMRSSDLLFLPMHNLPDGARAGIVPGKTYEYLAAGRPILGAVPDGDARDLLTAAGNALLCRPDDSAGMARLIAAELGRRRAGAPPAPPDPQVVARYERRRLTAELAQVFDQVTR
jgi:glycosyltransferase involved in cell wall biosynthesis